MGRVPLSERGGGADGETETKETGPPQACGSGARDSRRNEGFAGMEGMARRIRGSLSAGVGRHDRAIARHLRA